LAAFILLKRKKNFIKKMQQLFLLRDRSKFCTDKKKNFVCPIEFHKQIKHQIPIRSNIFFSWSCKTCSGRVIFPLQIFFFLALSQENKTGLVRTKG
jgi:hypothetical protein